MNLWWFVYHNSAVFIKENGGLRWRTRWFLPRTSMLSCSVIKALIPLHQRFDNTARTRRIVNKSNKPLYTPQKAFLRLIKSLFLNHIPPYWLDSYLTSIFTNEQTFFQKTYYLSLFLWSEQLKRIRIKYCYSLPNILPWPDRYA